MRTEPQANGGMRYVKVATAARAIRVPAQDSRSQFFTGRGPYPK